MKNCIIIITVLFLLYGCASGGNESSTKTIIKKDAKVRDVITETKQTEKGSTAETVGGDNTTVNADLSKGWGGMMAVRMFVALALLFIVGLLPCPKSWQAKLVLILFACASFAAAIFMTVQFYG